jgi:cytochrome c peroxidase
MPTKPSSFALTPSHMAASAIRAHFPLIHGWWPAVALMALSGCGGIADEADASATTVEQSLSKGRSPRGERLFDEPFRNTNGRSCATCHVRDEHTVLTPAHVSARLAADPSDPLFNRIDADDPLAAEPTYEHLKKGLVRVVLDLPDNMDLIDLEGNVVTGPERTVEVWRGVPTVENTAITAPYQYDGRRETLQEQAQGAVTAHSEGGEVRRRDLDAIAEFQEQQFSSDRARRVAKKLARGVPVEDIERPELDMELTPAQARGLELYNAACEACHGGATTTQVVNREVHDFAFVQLKPDGNVLFDTTVQPPVPVLLPRPNDEFLNIGTGNFSVLGAVRYLPRLQRRRGAAALSLPLLHRWNADDEEGGSAADSGDGERQPVRPAARARRERRAHLRAQLLAAALLYGPGASGDHGRPRAFRSLRRAPAAGYREQRAVLPRQHRRDLARPGRHLQPIHRAVLPDAEPAADQPAGVRGRAARVLHTSAEAGPDRISERAVNPRQASAASVEAAQSAEADLAHHA